MADQQDEAFTNIAQTLQLLQQMIAAQAAAPIAVPAAAAPPAVAVPPTFSAEHTARVDPRAIQNSRCLYNCLASRITGDLRIEIFGQPGNLPTHGDGPSLFKRMIDTTAAASLQVSSNAIQDLLNLDPGDYKFDMTAVNSQIIGLFTLATTAARLMPDSERCFYIFNTYRKIKQPQDFVNWTNSKADARLQANKSANHLWRTTTTRQDINGDFVAMIAPIIAAQKGKGVDKKGGKGKTIPKTPATEDKLPPFVRHFKKPESEGGTPYVIGNTKTYNATTWHFCGCPKHRSNLKWHTHPTADCKIRKVWLEEKAAAAAVANVGDVQSEIPIKEGSAASNATSGVTALLANALLMIGDDDALHDVISEALSALHQT
ncbi:unnamed protein product [Cylindrotheca closterium]|uniref:Uncharacterized protein n=1 Tax=Cylindrotheca closterium TaxID=2856 RepID=A0AAD2CQL6_9STRA|nr:unnamed protein product [Cylindrotheca closterium]